MTIQEAIKSGKPFKRKSPSLWITKGWLAGCEYLFACKKESNEPAKAKVRNLAVEDILADDWEVKEN